jgi:hypothetical protein
MLNVAGIAGMKMRQRVCCFVRGMDGLALAGAHFLAADVHGYIERT